MSFNAIFNEECVPFDVVSNIILDTEVIDGMECHSSVVTSVDRVSIYVRFVDSPVDVEVNWVPSKLVGLTYVIHLDIFDLAYKRFVSS